MPQIYVSQQEFEAIEFFREIAGQAAESADDNGYYREEYDRCVEHYNTFWSKFLKAKIKRKKNDQS